jgi:two-component system nitrate/nitrite response regulator NarL
VKQSLFLGIQFMSKSILIIDDHPIYRDALAMLVSRLYGESSVVTASCTEDGLARFNDVNDISLILLDLELPGVKGAEAVASLRRKFPDVDIIVISGSDERRDVEAVLRAGAKAFVSKAVSTTKILEIAQEVLDGKPLTTSWIAASGNHDLTGDSVLKLTERQKETLVFLCMGLSNKEIGIRLGLSEITVKTHVSAVFRALGVINRTQAGIAARRLGLYHEG